MADGHELVAMYVSELRTIQNLHHYLWRAGSRIHHSYLPRNEERESQKTYISSKWCWQKPITLEPPTTFITPLIHHTNQLTHNPPQPVSTFSMWLLSQHNEKKCFLRAVAHSGEISPIVVQSMRTVVGFVCWFWWEYCVMCVHMCLRGLSSHTLAGKHQTKRPMTSIDCNQRA